MAEKHDRRNRVTEVQLNPITSTAKLHTPYRSLYRYNKLEEVKHLAYFHRREGKEPHGINLKMADVKTEGSNPSELNIKASRNGGFY